MKAINKEFYVDIKKTIGRFISIFLIVALGVGFYAGIRSTEPDMRLTGDKLYDDSNLMDLRIISTMGLEDYDVEKIQALDCIDQAAGAYAADVVAKVNDDENVIRFMNLLDGMNEVTVTEGEKPVKADECMLDAAYMESKGFAIGDTVEILSAGQKEIEDVLTSKTFTITGAFTSTQYMSASTKGTSTVGNGKVEAIAAVNADAFALTVYTDIYATVTGAKEKTSYTNAYDKLVENAAAEIEDEVADVCIKNRYDELYDQATELILDIQKQEEEAQAGIDEGKAGLKKINAQIKKAKAGIADLEAAIETTKSSISEAQAAIDEVQQKVDAYDSYIEKYSDLGYVPSGTLNSYDVPMEQMEQEKQKYVDQQEVYQETITQLEATIAQCESQIAQIQDQITEAKDKKTQVQEEIATGEDGLAQLVLAEGDAVAARDELESPQWYVTDRNSIQTYLDYDQDADRISRIGIVFPVIFFLVAMLVCLTTMTRMVSEQRTQIGTLKALGYSKFSIAWKYIRYALLATVLGSVAGSIIGCKILPVVIVNAYKILYPSLTNVVTPLNVVHTLTATGIAIAIVLAATIFASYRTLSADAATLMRPEAPKAGKKVLLERIPFIWKHLGFYGKSTYRNMVRYKKRFFMTLFGVCGSMALLIVGFGLKDSTVGISDQQYGKLHIYDGAATLNTGASDQRKEEAKTFLEDDERITSYIEMGESTITVSSPSKEVTAYVEVPENPDSLSDYIVLVDHKDKKTELELEDDSVIITDKMARMMEVEAGDTITIEVDETTKKEVKVQAVAENYIYHYVYMNEATYASIFEKDATYNKVLFSVKDGVDSDALTEEMLDLTAVNNVTFNTTIQDKFGDVLQSIDIIVLVLLVSAGGLAFVVLYNLNNINLAERRRELATLKVLGFYDSEVTGYVYRENVLITILGIAVGCLLGVVLHRFVIVTAEIDAITFYRQIQVRSFVYSGILTAVFSIIINLAMYFKLKKIDLAASMKSVE